MPTLPFRFTQCHPPACDSAARSHAPCRPYRPRAQYWLLGLVRRLVTGSTSVEKQAIRVRGSSCLGVHLIGSPKVPHPQQDAEHWIGGLTTLRPTARPPSRRAPLLLLLFLTRRPGLDRESYRLFLFYLSSFSHHCVLKVPRGFVPVSKLQYLRTVLCAPICQLRHHGLVYDHHGLLGPDVPDHVAGALVQRPGLVDAQEQVERRLLSRYSPYHAGRISAEVRG